MNLAVMLGLVALCCYIIGSIPFGLLIGKMNNVDIREHGSGNIGATNVLRTLGKKWGYLCFLCDFLKGLLPVIIAVYVAGKSGIGVEYAPSVAVICTVLGHVFTIFLKFKGGKGIATSAGAIMALAPYALLVTIIIWVIVFKSSGYVSLASILGAIAIPFLALGENYLQLHEEPISSTSLGVLFVLGTLATVKHKSNIKRLMNGTEASFKKKKEPQA